MPDDFSYRPPAADIFLRNAVLIDENEAAKQDYLDLAALAVGAGATEAAKFLFAIAALEKGFSSEGWQWVSKNSRDLGLFSVVEPPVIEQGNLFMVDQATEEIRLLSTRLFAERTLFPVPLEDIATLNEPSLRDVTMFAEVAISEFEYFLQGEDTEQDISHMLKVLRSAKSWKPLDVTRFVGSGAAAIGTIAGFNRILRFLTINDAIIGDPIENRGIADLVSRFSPNGLGPYFSNVPNLCRNPCDFFLLIELANLPSTDDIDVWLLLLSNPLSTTATIDLAIECGGRGLPRSMELLLTRAIRNQSFYPDSLAQLKRIVNLSHARNLDEIALEAQTIIVKDRKFDGVELGILGDIYLSLGQYDEARQAYSRYMEVDPTEKRAWKAVAQFTEIEDRRNLKRYFLQVERR